MIALKDGVTSGVRGADGVALASIRGEMPTVHSTSLENCRFPHVASLNEDDGWLRRSLKPSIVSRLRECHSFLEGESPVEPLHGSRVDRLRRDCRWRVHRSLRPRDIGADGCSGGVR